MLPKDHVGRNTLQVTYITQVIARWLNVVPLLHAKR